MCPWPALSGALYGLLRHCRWRALWGTCFLPFTFILSLRNGIFGPRYAPNDGATDTVSKNRYHASEAAAALLKMAKAASDPAVAAGLIEAAAKLKDEAGELPPP